MKSYKFKSTYFLLTLLIGCKLVSASSTEHSEDIDQSERKPRLSSHKAEAPCTNNENEPDKKLGYKTLNDAALEADKLREYVYLFKQLDPMEIPIKIPIKLSHKAQQLIDYYGQQSAREEREERKHNFKMVQETIKSMQSEIDALSKSQLKNMKLQQSKSNNASENAEERKHNFKMVQETMKSMQSEMDALSKIQLKNMKLQQSKSNNASENASANHSTISVDTDQSGRKPCLSSHKAEAPGTNNKNESDEELELELELDTFRRVVYDEGLLEMHIYRIKQRLDKSEKVSSEFLIYLYSRTSELEQYYKARYDKLKAKENKILLEEAQLNFESMKSDISMLLEYSESPKSQQSKSNNASESASADHSTTSVNQK